MRNFAKYQEIALDLLKQGYGTVPAHGKRIFIKEWPRFGEELPTMATVKNLTKRVGEFGTNTAHVFGPNSPLVAIDIDIQEPVENRRACIAAWNILGKTPLVRIGKSPKVALFYRKQPGATYQQTRGSSVEIFADSGQMVLFGMHPDTNRAYKWVTVREFQGSDWVEGTVGRRSPLHFHIDEIPTLDPGRLQHFLGNLPTRSQGDATGRGEFGDVLDVFKEERKRATDDAHFMRIVDSQLGRMKSSKESQGNGTRSITIASVAYALTRRGLDDKTILGVFERHFKRWPLEARSLKRRAEMAIRSARRKQTRQQKRA